MTEDKSQNGDSGASRRQDRAGKKLIAAHVEATVYNDFKRLAAKNFATTDTMLHEALGLLFAAQGQKLPKAIRDKLQRRGRPVPIPVSKPTI
jgi:hypothetical protein